MIFNESKRCAHPNLVTLDGSREHADVRYSISCPDCGDSRHLTRNDWKRFVVASRPSAALLQAARGLDSGLRSSLSAN